jgi:AraC-like DNA-binding protein
MSQDHLYEPFQIVLSGLMDECPRQMHRHSFFELVYIVKGNGRHLMNESAFVYRPGHLFLLIPGDAHHFEIDKPTQLLFIRFNELYINSNKLQSDARQCVAFILKNAGNEPGCMLKNKGDKAVVRSIMEALMREHLGHDLYHRELQVHFVNTLIIILARNIAASRPQAVSDTTDTKALDILQYIQAHITEPEKIKAEAISRHFGISENYLGRYFKKHTHETLQEYIVHYKLRMVENKLLHSSMRLNEIASELGFTDKSHLNRLFRKYKGLSPGEYKKQQQALPVSA